MEVLGDSGLWNYFNLYEQYWQM